jgi:LPXTG-motif cell wall-anchored protein
MMKKAVLGATALTIALSFAVATPSHAATPDQTGVPTLGDDSTMTKLVYEDGTVVTMTYTNVADMAPSATIDAVMAVNPMEIAWGGYGDLSTAFTPNSLLGAEGLMIGWNSFADREILGCLPSTDTNNPQRPDWTEYPSSPNPYVCSNTATVTFTFSRPVTDAVLNLHNLAGGWYSGKASFYSSWTLSEDRTPGLTAELLSHAGNFQVSGGDTIEPIQPPGTGLTDAIWATDPRTNPSGGPVNSTPLDIAPQGAKTYYGSGSGAVLIKGTYTEVSFDVSLARYTNIDRTPNYFWDDTALEAVMVNWAMSTVTEEALPATGVELDNYSSGLGAAAIVLAVGVAFVLVRRRAKA